MRLAFFEDGAWRFLEPLTSVKPLFLLEVGGRRLYEYWAEALKPDGVALYVRDELSGLYTWLLRVREERDVEVNPETLEGETLAINHSLFPLPRALELAGKIVGWPGNVLVHRGGRVLMVKVTASFAGTLAEILRGEPTPELFLNLLESTTDVPFPDAPEASGPGDVLRYSLEVLSSLKSRIEGEVEEGVVMDTRRGTVVVDKGARVESGARLVGPVYLGPGVVVRAGSRIESCTLHSNSIVGGVLEECVAGPYCVAPDTRWRGLLTPGYAEFAPLTVAWGGVSVVGYATLVAPLSSLEGDCRVGTGCEIRGRFAGSLPPMKRFDEGRVEDLDRASVGRRLRRLLEGFGLLPSDYELRLLKK
mgnify:CR=1 FL=1